MSGEPLVTDDELRSEALAIRRMHDPEQQELEDRGSAWPGRCMHCHYSSHPCEVYDLASTVLMLLDRGRTDA